MSDWFETLDGLWDQAWAQMAQGVSDKEHPARQLTFATVSPDGWPEARTVVLRATKQAAAMLEIQTDLQSDKINSLHQEPRAALNFWIPEQRLQIRIQASVKVQSGPEVEAIWQAMPDIARQAYGITPAPGTLIGSSLGYKKCPDRENFAVLNCEAQNIDLLHLGKDYRRARFTRARDWVGEWLAP